MQWEIMRHKPEHLSPPRTAASFFTAACSEWTTRSNQHNCSCSAKQNSYPTGFNKLLNGKLTDMPTCKLPSHGPVNSWTGQLQTRGSCGKLLYAYNTLSITNFISIEDRGAKDRLKQKSAIHITEWLLLFNSLLQHPRVNQSECRQSATTQCIRISQVVPLPMN